MVLCPVACMMVGRCALARRSLPTRLWIRVAFADQCELRKWGGEVEKDVKSVLGKDFALVDSHAVAKGRERPLHEAAISAWGSGG